MHQEGLGDRCARAGWSALRLLETGFAVLRLSAAWLLGKPILRSNRLRETFEGLGATYVKVGQFVASAPSMFPRDLVLAFQNFLDQTRPLPYRVIERVLRRELGSDFSRLFATIEREPLASASVAQVHAATLHSGREVVLKVQKPGVEAKLKTDLRVLRLGLRLAERIYPVVARTGAIRVTEDMRRTFTEECDFEIEARRIRDFGSFLERLRLDDVFVPEVFDALTTRRLLVMERIRGTPLSGQHLHRGPGTSGRAVANAMNAWVTSVTHCDFFHADVHGGNLLLTDDGRVGFIDFGIVGRITPKSWDAALSFVDGLIRRDVRRMARALIDVGATHAEARPESLADDLEKLLAPSWIAGSTRHPESDAVLVQVFMVGEKHGLHFPRELFLLLKQYLYFDGYLRMISPGLSDVLSLGTLSRRAFD